MFRIAQDPWMYNPEIDERWKNRFVREQIQRYVNFANTDITAIHEDQLKRDLLNANYWAALPSMDRIKKIHLWMRNILRAIAEAERSGGTPSIDTGFMSRLPYKVFIAGESVVTLTGNLRYGEAFIRERFLSYINGLPCEKIRWCRICAKRVVYDRYGKDARTCSPECRRRANIQGVLSRREKARSAFNKYQRELHYDLKTGKSRGKRGRKPGSTMNGKATEPRR
jgi:hypothetical protein